MQKIGAILGIPGPDEITIEGSDFIDFSSYAG
jgi:hypothetical protein